MRDTHAVDSASPVRSINSKHGPIVSFGWWFTNVLTFVSVYFCWLRLARRGNLKDMAFDRIRMKPEPWWQDLGLIWWLLLGILALALVQEPNRFAVLAGGILAGYLIADELLYQVRVLWFDGLLPAIPDSGKKVWSNLRLIFVAILAYAWSIVLFYVIYRAIAPSEPDAPEHLLQWSFNTATRLDISNSLGAVSNIQVVVSLFFLAVVIATMVSVAYRREEIASSTK